ncbi:hypothetical protein CAL11_14590 [Bordetella genomosp. 6]|nr:hypothetical protein CAL11_14590 [Bordetella genomosp. 6]
MPAMRNGAAWVLEGRFMRFGWGLPALAVVLALAGCVNREPEERAAFIAYLEQLAAPQAGAAAAPPDPPTRKALGDYEAQYEPMEAAHAAVREALAAQQAALQALRLHSVDEIAARRDGWDRLVERLAAARTGLEQARADADAARAAMKQPPDLREAYARAYERSVTAPAQALARISGLLEPAVEDARRVAAFVARHRDQIDTDGPLTQVRDPSVRSELNVLLQALNGRSDNVSQAQALLNGLAGPARQAP